ncbi:MAG: hypothetical protein AB1765_07635 [Candidatus Hydrogenedentota bacterium]
MLYNKIFNLILLLISIFLLFCLLQTLIPYPVHWDSILYIRALDYFDISGSQPQAPGYIFYIVATKIIFFIIREPFWSYILLNYLSFIFLIFLMKKYTERYQISINIIYSILFSSPIFLYYINQVRPYIFVCLLFNIILYLFYICFREKRFLLFSSLLLGISGGVRQQDMVLLLPLYIFILYYSSFKKIYKLLGIGLFFIGICLWFIPLFIISGGILSYFKTVSELLFSHTVKIPLTHNFGMLIIGFFTLTPVGFFILFLDIYTKIRTTASFFKKLEIKNDIIFWGILFMPALIFYLFVHLNDAGYMLWLFIPISVYLSSIISNYKTRVKKIISFIVFIPGICYYLFVPSHYSFAFINRISKLQIRMTEYIKLNYGTDTVIIGDENYYFGFINLTYFLPRYRVFHIDEVYKKCTPSFYRRPLGTQIFSEKYKRTGTIYIPESTRNIIFTFNPLDYKKDISSSFNQITFDPKYLSVYILHLIRVGAV